MLLQRVVAMALEALQEHLAQPAAMLQGQHLAALATLAAARGLGTEALAVLAAAGVVMVALGATCQRVCRSGMLGVWERCGRLTPHSEHQHQVGVDPSHRILLHRQPQTQLQQQAHNTSFLLCTLYYLTCFSDNEGRHGGRRHAASYHHGPPPPCTTSCRRFLQSV